MSLSSSSSLSASSLSRRPPSVVVNPPLVSSCLLWISSLSRSPYVVNQSTPLLSSRLDLKDWIPRGQLARHTFYPRPSTHLKQANNGLRHIHERAMEKKTSVNIARTGLWNEIKMQDTCAKFMPVSRWEKKSTAASRHPPTVLQRAELYRVLRETRFRLPVPFPSPSHTSNLC